MGEALAPFPIAQSAPGTMMAEGLRQRQLDRLALRGSPTKALRVATSAEEVKNVTSFPAQPFARSDVTMLGKGDMTEESSRIKRFNEDAFETPNSPIRSNGSFGEVKRDGSAENANAVIGGKQFTISKVGNNGRIYLRYAAVRTITCPFLDTHPSLFWSARARYLLVEIRGICWVRVQANQYQTPNTACSPAISTTPICISKLFSKYGWTRCSACQKRKRGVVQRHDVDH